MKTQSWRVKGRETVLPQDRLAPESCYEVQGSGRPLCGQGQLANPCISWSAEPTTTCPK